jgi:hypothetical protein
VFVDNKKEGLVSELGPRVSGVWLLDWLVCWLRQMNMKNNENTPQSTTRKGNHFYKLIPK